MARRLLTLYGPSLSERLGPSVHDRRPRQRPRRPPDRFAHTMARGRDGRRLVAGRPARVRPGGVRVLGRRLRLAGARGAAQRFAQFRTDDRRPRHPLPPRALAARRRAAAGLTHGWPGSIVEFHKVIEPLTEPDRARRRRGRRVPRRRARRCPATASATSRPRTGWGVERIAARGRELMARLGYDRYVAQGGDWGSSVTTAHRRAATPSTCVGIHLNMPIAPARKFDEPTTDRREQHGARPRRRALPGVGLGLLEAAVDAPADARLRARRLAGRPVRVDPREVLGLDRLRRPSRERAHPRRAARQRDALLATGTGASSARLYWESFGRAAPPTVDDARRASRSSRRRSPPVAPLGGERYTDIRALERARQGRPLRRLRATRDVHQRGARLLPAREGSWSERARGRHHADSPEASSAGARPPVIRGCRPASTTPATTGRCSPPRSTPKLDTATWTFTRRGAGRAADDVDVGRDPRARRRRPTTGDIHCVTTWSKFGMTFTGVSVDTLLDGGRPAADRDARARVLAHRLHDEPAAGRRHRRQGVGRVGGRRRAAAGRARRPGAAARAAPLLLEEREVGRRPARCSTTTSPASGSTTAITTAATRGSSSATRATDA